MHTSLVEPCRILSQLEIELQIKPVLAESKTNVFGDV